jgi:MFS family permease
MSGAFFCGEAYIVFVLQQRWGLSAGRAGLALTAVGVTWAAASQLQSRLGERISHLAAMRTGGALVLLGSAGLLAAVGGDTSPVLAAAAYVVAGAGMGFGYPRTGVAMLEASTDRDRGFNSSALSIADSLGAALALATSGVVFAAAQRGGVDPFVAVFVLATVVAALAALVATRTGAARSPAPAAAPPAVGRRRTRPGRSGEQRPRLRGRSRRGPHGTAPAPRPGRRCRRR